MEMTGQDRNGWT